MKKVLSAITTAVIAAVLLSIGISAQVTVDDESYYAAFRDKGITLNVYNWGEYISDGTDGSLDIIEEFENI